MMNPIPSNTSLTQILKYLEGCPKWGFRNRALYAVRQSLRIKDIAVMKVEDILNLDMTIRCFYTSPIDYTKYELDEVVRSELHRYLISLQNTTCVTLQPIVLKNLSVPLFGTQKRERFSPNTLAQHYSLLDKKLSLYFVKRDITKKRPITQLFKSLANVSSSKY